METPWFWWADSARRYLAVLDPVMQMKRATEFASIESNGHPDACRIGLAGELGLWWSAWDR